MVKKVRPLLESQMSSFTNAVVIDQGQDPSFLPNIYKMKVVGSVRMLTSATYQLMQTLA